MYNKVKAKVQYMARTRHTVSAKVMLLNEAGDKVLMTIMHRGRYGLPGGHIDGAESPDEALVRELHEELGLRKGDYENIEPHTFFRAGTRLILLYIGTLKSSAIITPDIKEITDTAWVSLGDVESGKIPHNTYSGYIKKILTK